MAALDATDLQLIRLLQDQPRASHAELSRLTGISISTVRRRVTRLLDSGAISFSVYPNVWEMGYKAVSLIGINADYSRIEEIANQIREIEEVTLVLITLGRYDLFAGVALHDVEEVYPFLKERIATIEGVKDFETFVSGAVIKEFREWRVPQEDLTGDR
ncbi:MAG TPA: Lrp/AsnC family transcriptional regulator [Thermomicrobiales bacterium]|nr:Lrp/AsnC family transcriptional regulator [Thermomicrobiales bacterium]